MVAKDFLSFPITVYSVYKAFLTFIFLIFTDGESGQQWILLESRLEVLYKDPKKAKFEVMKRMKGSELKGKKYVPLFPYFQHVGLVVCSLVTFNLS
jgi:isoleucyl-tRNA synthetase